MSSRIVLSILFGLGLYFVNYLALWHAVWRTPAGFVPLWIPRSDGIAAQVVWFEAFKDQFLLPAYQAPWITTPAFFTPLKFIVGRLAGLFDVPAQYSYLTFLAIAYIFASCSFFYALRVFSDSRKQAICAFILSLCFLPANTIKNLYEVFRKPLHELSALHDFIFTTGDGFFHGINGSLSSAFGTGVVILAFALIARYLETEDKRFLRWASIAAFFSGFFHPFEVFVITGGGALAFLIHRKLQWNRFLPESLILCGSGALGVAIYVYQALAIDWLKAQATITRWDPGSPFFILKVLGFPLMAALLLALLQPKMDSPRTLILRCWILAALVGIYVPIFTWSQHFLDGVGYAAAMLLVREAMRFNPFRQFAAANPRLLVAAMAIVCCLALVPHVAYRIVAFHDGIRQKPLALMTGVGTADEHAVIGWLRANGQKEDLVLGPRIHAAWFATAPMHSFASHPHLGITYETQVELQRKFYAGQMPLAVAERMLSHYGVKFAVIPEGSPALTYMRAVPVRAHLGSLQVYEFPGHTMKPFRSQKSEEHADLELLRMPSETY